MRYRLNSGREIYGYLVTDVMLNISADIANALNAKNPLDC